MLQRKLGLHYEYTTTIIDSSTVQQQQQTAGERRGYACSTYLPSVPPSLLFLLPSAINSQTETLLRGLPSPSSYTSHRQQCTRTTSSISSGSSFRAPPPLPLFLSVPRLHGV